MTDVKVINGTLSQEEINAYLNYAMEKYPKRVIRSMQIDIDGDYVNLSYEFEDIPFQRIRRITGYLVGDLSRFNNAKRSEVDERVKHNISETA